jgi:uncharacterized protein YgiB involved in biofilm formation
MPGKLNLKTTAGLAAALAMFALSGAASAQRLNEPRPECMEEVRAYCATYWNTAGQPPFANQQACVDHYDEMCYYEWTYHY